MEFYLQIHGSFMNFGYHLLPFARLYRLPSGNRNSCMKKNTCFEMELYPRGNKHEFYGQNYI